MFFERAGARGDRPFLWHKAGGAYRPTSWAEAARRTIRLAHGLRALGIMPRDSVALIAENRSEWLIPDMAHMAAGAIRLPCYTTTTADDQSDESRVEQRWCSTYTYRRSPES